MKKLTIVVPVYNEATTIREVLLRIASSSLPDIEKEIIIVDDASIDGTQQILQELKDTHKVIFQEKNQGKGAALRRGFQDVTGDFVLIQDADLEYDPREYSTLIQPILENRADVVYGSRFMGGKAHRVLFFWHYVGNQFLTLLSNMFTDLNLTDMETCYKIFTIDSLKQIRDELVSNRFGIEPEITARIAKKKLKIYEVGISYNGRTYAEGKKINWKDGFWAIWCILRFNLFK